MDLEALATGDLGTRQIACPECAEILWLEVLGGWTPVDEPGDIWRNGPAVIDAVAGHLANRHAIDTAWWS